MLRRVDRDRAIALAFVAAAYALAFWQRPGVATSDTKIDLHVNPWRFLADVASVWTPTTDLGEVHSAQYSGYLWPMGPFFAAFHALGLSPWVIQRLWLGLMLALAAWGCLKLLDELVGRPRGIVHVVATIFFVVNPYTVVFTGRTSITLLGYAALPWLLLAVWKGVRVTKGIAAWWWPALFALIFMSTGGGVNAAVVFWMAAGPLVLLVYEPLLGGVRWRDSLGFFLRALVLALAASLWWIVPLLVHVKFGIDFLQFTEQPRTIWATNSSTESLRLMGYWTSYIGVSFYGPPKPYFSDGPTMLFSIPVVGAGLLLPALAALSFGWTRRHRYAPFFLALVLVGVVIMLAGFPNGTPLRHGMEWVYENIFVLRFMRTVNKAAPLVALGLGGLLGIATSAAWTWIRTRSAGAARSALRVALPVGLTALIIAAAWPLVAGDAIDDQITWDEIPEAWRASGDDLDAELPDNTRAMVLPGQVFAFYGWGGTIDHVLPRLTDKPVAVRYETPYSDLHAVDLLLATDQLVQQNRLVPGQLRPLLDLMGVGAVVSGTDDDLSRSGAVSPGTAAAALAAQGLARPDRSYGPLRPVPPAAGDLGPATPLPRVRRYDLDGGRGLVHVAPVSPPTIVDGSADGIVELAAFGGVPKEAPILYAGDLPAGQVQAAARRGASVVVTDSNRRRIFLPQHSQQNLGPTITAQEPIIENAAVINPFDRDGADGPAVSDGQTVSVLRGARYISATQDVGANAFPEHRPYAAFDGRVDTSWLADRTVAPKDRWIEIGFDRPRDVPYVDVYPANGPRGIVESVEIGGRVTPIGPGWTRVPVGSKDASALRVRLADVRQPIPDRGSNAGLRELRVPGLQVSESLRAPVLAGRALAGRDLRRTELTYLLSRTTGDDPFRRDPQTGDPGLGSLRSRADAERTIDRIVFSPAARSYEARAWVNPAVDAPDPALDRLAGVRSETVFSSSGRFHGQPGFRASSAFDGDPRTSWMGVTIPGEAPPPWIAWRTRKQRALSSLRLVAPVGAVQRPTLVRVSWPGGRSGPLTVAAGGRVALPRTVRARTFRVTILRSEFPPGVTARERARRAVGIASVEVPGLKPVDVPRTGALRAPCGSVALRVGGREVLLRPTGTLARFDAGAPLPARGCRGAAVMGAGVQEIHSRPGAFSVDLLSLRSAAPAGLPAPLGGGRVVDPGDLGRSAWDGVKVDLRGPSWLVLGESFDEGWRATCDGRDLGKPTPIDGYANGWRAPASCRAVAFSFAPQGGVNAAYTISAAVIALLLLFLVVFARRRAPVVERMPDLLPERPQRRLPAWQAALVGIVAAIPLAYVFSLRSGPPLAVGIALVVWRGWGPRALAIAAGLLLGVVIPLLYLLQSPKDEGGYNFGYSVELIDAHWVGVAAIVMLGMACWQTVARALPRARRAPSTGGSRRARSTPRPAKPVAMTSHRPDGASPRGW